MGIRATICSAATSTPQGATRSYGDAAAVAAADAFAERLRVASRAANERFPAHALRWAAARALVAGAVAARAGARAAAAALAPDDAVPPASARAWARARAVLRSGTAWPVREAPPTFAALGDVYPALLAPGERKRQGAWFTCDALAGPTAARALAPLLRAGDPAAL